MDWLKNIPSAHLLEESRIIAMLRGIDATAAVAVVNALYEGGIKVIEVTMNTAQASKIISVLSKQYENRIWIGAGTVCNLEDAAEAYGAGAKFFVTPNVDEQVIAFGKERNVPVISGAFTPTEVIRAWQAGAALTKLFPVQCVGAQYMKDLQGPLSHIPMLAVGGVSALNAAEYVEAGAWGIGVGGNLVDKDLIAAGNFDALRKNAASLQKIMNAARKNT